MDKKVWSEARKVFHRGFRTSMHYAVASVGTDGMPHVSPLGSVMLTGPGRGILFDVYTSTLARNLDADPRVCILAVDSGPLFWLRSLALGRFVEPPALRLSGVAGPRRPSTPNERARWLRRVRLVRRLRGHDLLWKRMGTVRDLELEGVHPVHLGAMTSERAG